LPGNVTGKTDSGHTFRHNNVRVAEHDIIAIGGSAGSVEPLSQLVSGLPPDLNAAVFVVVHLSPWSKSQLPEILSRWGPLRACHPVSGEAIEPGNIYVAPPNNHLLVTDSHVELWQGPKENRQRPSINALFRSASVSHGERVIGVVLSGCLDDGSAGLWWIKRFGGLVVVQNPDDAEQPEMPGNALQHVTPDYVLNVDEMPGLLARLVTSDKRPQARKPGPDSAVNETKHIIETTCPDCNGPLSEIHEPGLRQYRCLVGHTYSARSLLESNSEAQERSLWTAVVKLEESAKLVHLVSPQLPGVVAATLKRQADRKVQQAAAIRKILEQLEPFQLE
jgi:two-component system chemotaxis response regulator CheB